MDLITFYDSIMGSWIAHAYDYYSIQGVGETEQDAIDDLSDQVGNIL